MNVGILGMGEVGSAIKKLVSPKHHVFVRELNFDQLPGHQIDVLHICIPFTPSFTKSAVATIKEVSPQLVIVDSTVKPGTTNLIYQQTHTNIAHAPILGVHPHLYEYLFKFTKPLGAINPQSFRQAKKHFEDLGVKTEKFDSPLESEMAKILGTTYYGWAILFEKWVHHLCQQQGTNFDQVYTRYNQIYNQGYQPDLPHVVRPVLTHQFGPIGGHCVIPNSEIINTWVHDDFTAFIIDQNQKLGKSQDE